jgi:hypothetical protein
MLKNSLNKFAKSVLLSSFLLGSHLLASEVTQIRNATVKINYGGKVLIRGAMRRSDLSLPPYRTGKLRIRYR